LVPAFGIGSARLWTARPLIRDFEIVVATMRFIPGFWRRRCGGDTRRRASLWQRCRAGGGPGGFVVAAMSAGAEGVRTVGIPVGTKLANDYKLLAGRVQAQGHSYLVSGVLSDYTRHLIVLTK
jgi:hypothetical protein